MFVYRDHPFETKFIAAMNQTKHLTTNNPKHAVQDHVDIGKLQSTFKIILIILESNKVLW